MVITGIIAVLAQMPNFANNQADVYVSNYTAVFHSDFVLEESYTYKVNVPEKHFLYRFWEIRLSLEQLNISHIQLLDISFPSNSIGYIKDYQGNVFLYESFDDEDLYEIHEYAYLNEVGAYSQLGYDPGEYTVKYWFKIVPPLETDDEYIHFNMKLADSHIIYENVRIMVEDSGNIESIFTHPPTLKESRRRNMIVFTGNSGEDELLEFEMLMDRDAKEYVEGFYRNVDDVKGLTVGANDVLEREYLVAYSLLWLTKLSGIFMPLVFAFIWQKYGREKEIMVPRFLSMIPVKTRKPWIVNLIFKKEATDFDEDGFFATLIDMHLQEKIKIEENSDDLTIRILDDKGLDSYESEVMIFLKKLSGDQIISSEHVTNMIESAKNNLSTRTKLFELKYNYDRLIHGTHNKVASAYTESGRKRLWIPITYALILIIVNFSGFILSLHTENILFRSMGYSITPLLQIMVAAFFPSTLFGYWKEDFYHEKLQWEAFKRHLIDFSRIERYGAEDLEMWGKWLVYGTSLGVGKNVADALKKLEIPIDVATSFPQYRALFNPILVASFPSSSSSSSRSSSYSSKSYRGSGGGFGGGKGFGGGGSGVR